MRWIVLVVVVILARGAAAQAAPSPRQDPQQDPKRVEAEQAPGKRTDPLAAIGMLVKTMDAKREELRVASAKSPGSNEVVQLQAELDKLEADFDSLATGIDRAQLKQEGRKTTLAQELEDLLRPILEQLKDATEEPRQLERLRSQAASHKRRQQVAKSAIQNIRALQDRASDPAVAKELDDAYLEWQAIQSEAVSGEAVAQAQLDQIERNRESLVESVSGLIGGFFRSKGLNLVLAVLAFLGVFFGMRFATSRAVQAVASKRKKHDDPFYFRLISVLYQVAVVVVAVFAGLLVLYVAGDWVLLGLALLFLLGLAWAAKNTLPRLLEELRMLLNLGPVRETERVVFGGLPWKVERLSLYSRLVNPALSGGKVRLPLRDLVGLHSRPSTDKEAWFPCAEGDWVRLSDGTRGKVLTQTPEMVQLVKLGGSRVTYRTADFLGMSPDNLSANFRLPVTFGVDYRHQAICTTEIPKLMRERLHREIVEKIGAENLVHLTVEFKEAGSSSLDYEVIVDLRGEVAARLEGLKRLVQRVLVDACNEQGWVIPFTQVTLHQASPSGG